MIKKSAFFILFLCFFQYITASWHCNIPPNPCANCRSAATSTSNENVLSASFFIQGYSQFFLLINQAELSGINRFNIYDAQLRLSNTIKYLTISQDYARQFLIRLESDSSALNYLEAVNAFDFQAFALKNHYNSGIMEELQTIFQAGGYKELFYNVYEEVDLLLKSLKEIQFFFSATGGLDLEKLQTAYIHITRIRETGFYASLVFKEIARVK